MMNWYIALPVTVLIIVASAFFVVIEFSLQKSWGTAFRCGLQED